MVIRKKLSSGILRILAAPFLSLAAIPGHAETWAEQKCAIFTEAWAASAPVDGPKAPSPAFRGKVEGFIASGCTAPRNACPETPADIAILDALALIVAMEGMSTTFLPVQCPAG
jgi:hypothetical protein